MNRILIVRDITAETVDAHPGRDHIWFAGGSSRVSPPPPGLDEKKGYILVTPLRVEKVPIQRVYSDSEGEFYVAFRGSVHDEVKRVVKDLLFDATARVRSALSLGRECASNPSTLKLALVLSWSLILVLITALTAQ